MKDLLEYIVKSLVNNPDEVSIEEVRDGETVNLNLSVNPEDMGIVIGKGGANIKAVRKVLGVRAMMENVRVYINLVEPEGSQRPQRDSEESEDSDENEVAPVTSEESIAEAPEAESAEEAAEVFEKNSDSEPQESTEESEEK